MNEVRSESMTPLNCGRPAIPVWEWQGVLLLIALLAGMLIARLSVAEALGSANDRSRWCTIWSLTVRGTYQIDEIIQYPGWDSIDKVRHEGHFYSSKPPLYPTMLAGMVWGLKQTTGLSLSRNTDTVAQIVLFWVNVFPFLIAIYCWWRLLISAGFPPLIRILLVGLTCFTTPLLPYMIALNNHTTGATSLMFALAAAVKIIQETSRKKESTTADSTSKDSTAASPAGIWFALCGFFAAYTCCNELPAALFGLLIFGVMLRCDIQKTLLWFVPAALIPLIAFFVTTYIVTGGWKPFYMYYGTEKYEYVFQGVPSYWTQPRGLDKAQDSVPAYMFHCLLGHHGVFSLTPLFLLAIPGYYRSLKDRTNPLWWIHLMGVIVTVVIFAFYWKRTENYNYGGVSVALRWVLWLIPFWLLAIAEQLRQTGCQRRLTLALIVLGIPSVFSAWAPWQTPWQQPWLYQVMEQQGWIDYSDSPPPLEKNIYGCLVQLPAAEQTDPDYWIEFLNGNGDRLRIADGGPVEIANQAARKVVLTTQYAQGTPERRQALTVAVEPLEQGRPVADYLLAWEDSWPAATEEDQYSFLRGLPISSAYRPGYFQYLHTPVREDAFRCRHVASRIVQNAQETLPKQEVRCDLWFSEELPFGLCRRKTSVTHVKEELLFSREIWTVDRVGKLLTATTAPEEVSQENLP